MTSPSDISPITLRPTPTGARALRAPGLDAIRVIAILLVLGRHMPIPPGSLTGPMRWILDRWQLGGWVGVDLFFVLSGFLVSGLLFTELRTTGRMRIARFYGRRAFKIYPAFYFFLPVSAAIAIAIGFPAPPARVWLAEALFVQSYVPALWNFSWSLAVEEHFYLVLPLLLTAIGLRQSASRRDARAVVAMGLVIGAVCLGLRTMATIRHPQFDAYVHVFPSHLRLDSLMCGVVIGYFWTFHPEKVGTLRRWKGTLFLAGVVLLLLPFRLPLESAAMHSFGLTTNYLGAAAILLATLLWNSTSAFVRALGFFGPYTYSTYLWHQLVLMGVPVGLGYAPRLMLYVAGAYGVGWLTSTLVEWPALRLRDRLLPRRAPGESTS